MTTLSRRHFFGLTAGLMASAAIPASVTPMVTASWDAAVLQRMLDARFEGYDIPRYTAEETEVAKARGGWGS